jgi:hypothetical protein
MSGYLHRMVSSALRPGGSIHPMLGSVFSASTYQRAPEDIQGERSVSSLIGPEFPVKPQKAESDSSRIRPVLVTPPPATIPPGTGPIPDLSDSSREAVPEETTHLQRLVNTSLQGKVEKPVIPAHGMSYGDSSSDEPEKLASKNEHEIATVHRHVPGVQSAEPKPGLSPSNVPPLPGGTPMFGNAKQNGSTELASETVHALVTKAQKNDREKPTATPKGRYQPLMPESLSRTDGPRAFRPVTSSPTPNVRKDVRKEERARRLNTSGSPEREADEIQIHIGRIEVTAVPPPTPAPVRAPARKSISLDEYLKRKHGS